ncbi:FAD-dependent oxidoreductase [Candidatus Poribacteria bacterium]|nr:FAD-dependent oxidoreductase [Candidatus Poribacteria bacterium]
MPKYLIIGAGPTGLGAARRLEELGQHDWLLVERQAEAGGLAGSFTDDAGFTWDLGGHVQFSHYAYFDKLMDELLGGDGWIYHEREAWVWMRGRFIPYPFQNNIRHLPHGEMAECVLGIARALKEQDGAGKPRNFAEFFEASMGAGIARVFMRPYNFKVWAYPPEELDYHWIGDRVSVVDLERVLGNIFAGKDDISWGPNNRFRFPKTGGTGSIWRECARRLPADRLRFSTGVEFVDTARRRVRLEGGEELEYERLISSIPLDTLIRRSDLAATHGPHADKLVHSSTNIFGLGLRGTAPEHLKTKCWMYFPEEDNPFYRVTVFSNYSPGNVPDPARYWSLMAEVSESPAKPVQQERLLDEVIQGALNTRLIASREDVVDTWSIRLEHGYPTPSLRRDEALRALLPDLESRGVFSRGRFGAWKYEVSNQDHSLMQGVECVDHLELGTDEWTLWYPEVVNGPKPWKRR